MNLSMSINVKMARDIYESLSDDFKNRNNSFITKIEDFISQDEKGKITSSGESLDRKSTSIAQSYIFTLYRQTYPASRVKQEASIELNVDGVKTKCRFDIIDYDYKLIIEINGSQHDKFVPFFHKNKQSFTNQQDRDEFKKKWCMENGWAFLVISDKQARDLRKLTPMDAKTFLLVETAKALDDHLQFSCRDNVQ